VNAVIGFRVFGRHDDRRYALRVLNGLLGENMSFPALSERARAPRSLLRHSVELSALRRDGIFAVSGGFDAARARAALKLTAKELRGVVDRRWACAN
jgi:hypothetical protein